MNTKQNQNRLYRLLHVKFNTVEVAYDDYENFPEYFAMQPFKLPDHMSADEAMLVISYINERVNAEHELPKGSQRGISFTNKLLKKYNFEQIESGDGKDGIVDLITTSGFAQYIQSDPICKEKFFKWYNPNVSRKSVFDIYKKCGFNLDQIEKNDPVLEK